MEIRYEIWMVLYSSYNVYKKIYQLKNDKFLLGLLFQGNGILSLTAFSESHVQIMKTKRKNRSHLLL